MQRYQEGAQQRGRLHPDPHDAEIVGNEDQHHRRERAEPEGAKAVRDREGEAVLAGFMGEIHAGEDRAEQKHQNEDDQVEGGKGVDVKPPLRRGHKAVAEDAGPDIGREPELDRRYRDDQPENMMRPRQRQTEQCPQHRHGEHCEYRIIREHPVSPSPSALSGR